MSSARDWHAWHEPYRDPGSPLSRRLRLVQQHIDAWLDEGPGEALTAVSACAGQGHDLLGVLATRPDASRVRATLLEYDEGNVAAARAAADRASLHGVAVRKADAGDPASYFGAVPADLLLMVGVFGNISDGDVARTIHALPQLCAEGATVIWTRSRRPPDLTPTIRAEFEAAGFVQQACYAPADVFFTVGVHRLTGTPQPLVPAGRFFRFLR